MIWMQMHFLLTSAMQFRKIQFYTIIGCVWRHRYVYLLANDVRSVRLLILARSVDATQQLHAYLLRLQILSLFYVTNSACKLIWFSSTFTRFNCAGQVFVSAVSMQWWHARWAPLVRKSCEYFFFCVTLETHVGSWHAPYRGASQYFVMRASIYMRLFSVLRCNQHQRA